MKPMRNLLAKMTFTQLLAIVLIANVITLAVCNLFSLPTFAIVFVYPASVFAGWWLLRKIRPARAEYKISRPMIVCLTVFLAAMALPRFVYVLEWLPGNIVHVTFDDPGRLAELISITQSPHFPLQHPANQNYLFSFYYAAFLPLAFLKFLLPILTLKDIIFLGNTFYQALILFSLLEVANLLLPSRRSLWVLIYLCTFFGGLDWLADIILKGRPLLDHHEWWQACVLFNGNAQISSFFTGLAWVPHHFIAFYACVLAFVFTARFRFPNKTAKSYCAGLLLISAFYSSVFAFLPAMLLLPAHLRTIKNRFLNIKVLPLLLAVFLVPLYIYTNKLPGPGFIRATFRIDLVQNLQIDRMLSLPLWVVVVPVVEFCAIPYLAMLSFKDFTRKELYYFKAAAVFFISTYSIAYAGANNFSMRGMLLPTFIFFFLFAKYPAEKWLSGPRIRTALVRSLVTAIVLLGAFGTLLEMTWFLKTAFWSNALTWRLIKGPEAAAERFPVDYRALARRRDIKIYEPTPEETSDTWYNAEKMIDLPIEALAEWERELIRLPRKSFFY